MCSGQSKTSCAGSLQSPKERCVRHRLQQVGGHCLQCIDESIFLITTIFSPSPAFLVPMSTSLVSSPGFMNLRSILTLRCALPVWKSQIQQHVERLLSGSICLAKAHPHCISDWLVDLSFVWLNESYRSLRSRKLYVRSLGKPDFVLFAVTPVRQRSGTRMQSALTLLTE